MSDIPVGSPPAPPGRHAAPSGWYPDPLDLMRERYWDGWQWSRNTRVSETPAAHARPVPAGAPTPPYGAAPVGPYGHAPQQRPSVVTADGVPVAGWGWRVLAGLLDGLLTGVAVVLASLPFYRSSLEIVRQWWVESLRSAQAGGQPLPTPDVAGALSAGDQVLISLVALAIGLVYQVVLLRLRGATLGLSVCGLRVVPVDQGRSTEPLGWGRVWIRALAWLVPWNVPGLFVLTVADVLVPLWHPKRQTLHDLAARTQVVKVR